MPAYDSPRSDVQRVSFLKRTAAVGKTDEIVFTTSPGGATSTSGEVYVSAGTLAAIDAFLPSFTLAFETVTGSQSLRSREVAERVAAIDEVQTYTRDLMEGAKRRIYRLKLPAAVLEFYQMQLDGSVPNPTTQDDWLTLSDRIVAGDAQAVAAGYAAMSNPSAAELAAVITAARQEATEADAADRVYDQAQAAVAALRARADELITDVVEEIRFNTRKKDAASQRRILRTYGAQFRYLPGETPDEEPVPAEAVAV